MTELERSIAVKEFAIHCTENNVWLRDFEDKLVLFTDMIESYLATKENKENAK